MAQNRSSMYFLGERPLNITFRDAFLRNVSNFRAKNHPLEVVYQNTYHNYQLTQQI